MTTAGGTLRLPNFPPVGSRGISIGNKSSCPSCISIISERERKCGNDYGQTPHRERAGYFSMVTIRELAKKCGCSASTVSMVLNNRPLARYIRAGTKASIRRIAEEMKYQPNIFAQSLRANRSYTVGVMVFDITDPYCTYTLRGIENILNAASITYLL